MSQEDTEQTSSDGGRNSFTATLHRMLTQVSKTSPELMGWTDCGKMFYFHPYTDGEAMKKAIAPFFSHANFASMRRQLSAYQFLRGESGNWHHRLFHRRSTDEDLAIIQKGRRRRGQFAKEQARKSKTLKEYKSMTLRATKSASAPRNALKGVGPLANVDINSSRAHKPKGHPHFSSKRQNLPSVDSRPALESSESDSDSIASYEESSEFLDHDYPLTTVLDRASAAAIVKRNVLSTYFCKTCLFMDGKICCNKCPKQHHERCKTSRCVCGTQHPDLMQILA